MIDKNIPIPKSIRGLGSRIYPFPNMKVGDSHFCELNGIGINNKQASIFACLSKWKQTSGNFWYKITTRRVEEKGEKGIRFWRIN